MPRTRITSEQTEDQSFLTELEFNEFFQDVVITGTENATSLTQTFSEYFPGQALVEGLGNVTVSSGTVVAVSGSTDPSVDSVLFSLRETGQVPHQEGLVFYDKNARSLVSYNDEQDIALNIGQENWLRVRNESGQTIPNGSVVRIVADTVSPPKIDLAQANSVEGARVIGVATHDIANNSTGYTTTFGIVRDIDTSGLGSGSDLFLSASVAGKISTTQPAPPELAVYIGKVLIEDSSEGQILVNISPLDQALSVVNVFGAKPQQGFVATSESTSTTTSTSFQEKLSLVAAVDTVVTGTSPEPFRLTWHYEWGLSPAFFGNFQGQIQVDDTDTISEIVWRPGFSGDDLFSSSSGFIDMTLSSGTHFFDLDFLTTSAIRTAIVRRARLALTAIAVAPGSQTPPQLGT